MLLRLDYERAAYEYSERLPLEHFMESTLQSTQRRITDQSMDLVRLERPDVQNFGELLIQYPKPRGRKLGQVVPDNMIVVWPEPIKAKASYDIPLQPVRPFWTLEYLSHNNKRKDYVDSFRKYERDLEVPYYLMFDPDDQEITLYHLVNKKYRAVRPNAAGRREIPELDIEVGLVDEWMRYWFRGKLLPLVGELGRSLQEADRRATEAEARAEKATAAQHAAEEELARLRAELEERKRPRKNHK
jgi:Uma2 family endonuclease